METSALVEPPGPTTSDVTPGVSSDHVEGSTRQPDTEVSPQPSEPSKPAPKPSNNRQNMAKQMRQQSGLAFLLNQMRSDENSSSDVKSDGKNGNVTKAEKRSAEAVGQEESKKSRIEPASVSYPWLDEQISSKTPSLDASGRLKFTVSDCFCSGTTPKFEFAQNCPENNYVRSVKYSPCGKYLISDSEDRRVRIFDVNEDDSLTLRHEKLCGGLIYHTQWARSGEYFGTTSTHSPIHIWVPRTAEKLATFRGMNHLDVLEHALAFDFTLDQTKCYGSYHGIVRRFDFNRPGRQVSQIKTYKKREGGQSSMLPSLTFSPIFDGVFAVGSIQNSVGIYSDQTNSCDTFIQTEAAAIGMLKYSKDGYRLFVGGNASDAIECYDTRFPTQIWAKYARPAVTNQRIHLDLDSDEKYLFSGSTNGTICIFDLKKSQISLDGSASEPVFVMENASESTVAGLSLHPYKGVMATSHGQRVFPPPRLDGEFIFESQNGEEDYIMLKKPLDNSIKVWSLA
ncbi:unnamed protein product [Bursaphelenchus xylophilus]|uniref:WD repeat-containing protein 79 n=1 Tax=Bursaphelenchus xylophilus TaxID=6326 RepID=A0A1I7S0F3_BURXY|nr:unnamed protein product [Bursaphelenchus xylophilus]CAG9132235.1 unnamed protein product [Bursaphelenchus xylophilus]